MHLEETDFRGGADNIKWVRSFISLGLMSISVFMFNRLIDKLLIENGITFFSSFFNNEIGDLTNTLGGLGEVISAVLGIEITSIAIIVQLAANKYSPKIMDLFINNRLNMFVFTFFVITASNTVMVTNTITADFVPYYSIFITFVMIIFALLIFLPHFIYVFNFLRPTNFLFYLHKDIVKNFGKLSRQPFEKQEAFREKVKADINFLGDMALNSIYQGDRAVTLLCITTIRRITVEYIKIKPSLPEEWFKRTGFENLDPDFSSYSPYVMEKVEERKILLERKIFRLFELIFHKSHLSLRDVAGGVLMNTELIALEAIKGKDDGVLQTIFQYFNTYLRLAITDKSPRTAFNTLEHYRIVAEKLLDNSPEDVEKISQYFKYYGQEANKNRVLFILETAAYDLCRLNELAYIKKVKNLENLLYQFLNLDEPLEEELADEDKSKELSLIGVRIAQVKLAGFYLLNEEYGLARIIFQDLKVEPNRRIKKIKDIIFRTTQEEFWEINPRGYNFYYVSPERRKALVKFFSWFEEGISY